MADESHYSSGVVDASSNKRKYEEQTTPPPSSGTRRPTGFSSGPIPSASPDPAAAAAAPPPPSYNSVPPPMDEIQMAKQKAQEIAARLLNSADAKRPRVDNGASFDSGEKGFSSGPSDGKPLSGSVSSNIPVSYGSYQGTIKKIEIPNMRVGVIIGKGGETIKYLQLQSGAKIQVTRDMDADPNAPTRTVELTGTPDQIAKAEQLINDVLQEAEAGSSGGVSRRTTGQAGSEQFVMKVPDNKVGLVIGKGGETIKSMQAKSGALIQVIPLHLPPGDTSSERTIQIDGTSDQIEHAKHLVNEVISGEHRLRNPSVGGGYPPQGYQARPPSSWAPPGAPQMQQPGYGYMQPGAYPGPSPQYQSPYRSYPQQTSSGYPSNWDQSSAPSSQQASKWGFEANTGFQVYSCTQGVGPSVLISSIGENLTADFPFSVSENRNELSSSLATSNRGVIGGTNVSDQCSEISLPAAATSTRLASEQASCSSSKDLSLSFPSIVPTGFILGSKYLQAVQEILAQFASYSLEGSETSSGYSARGTESGPYPAFLSGFWNLSGFLDGDCNHSESRSAPALQRRALEAKKAQLLNLLQGVDDRYSHCLDEIHTVVSAFHAATELDPQLHTRFALKTVSFLYKNLRERISNQILAMGSVLDNNGGVRGKEKAQEYSFLQQHCALQQLRRKNHQLWRPQRGLPEKSVSILRAWMFQNFLHPYPKDSEKHLLAIKSGLTRSQVSNWFINARVRLWKPMIEEMYGEMNRRKANNDDGGNEGSHRRQCVGGTFLHRRLC